MNFKNFIFIPVFHFLCLFTVFSQTIKKVTLNTNGLIRTQEINGTDSLVCLVIHPEILFTSDGLIHFIGFDNQKELVSLNTSNWIEVQRKIISGQTSLYKQVAFPVELTDKENVIGYWDSQKTVLAVEFSLILKPKQQISLNLQSASLKESTTGYLANFPFSSGRWVKVKVTEEGVYSIKKSDLSRFGFSGSEDGTKLQVYSSSGKNAGLLGTTEIPLWTKITEQSDISNDQVYYFFTPINKGIEYNPGLKKYAHYLDIFDDNHYVYIGFGSQNGKRISTADFSNLSTTVTYTEGRDLIWDEQEKENLIKSGTHWLGQSLIENSSLVMTPKLLDYKPGTTIDFQTKVVSRRSSTTNARFNIYDHDLKFISDFSTQEVIIGSYTENYATEKTTSRTSIPPITEDRLKLKYEFISNSSAIGWIDWYEAEYTKTLSNAKNEISFYITSLTNLDGLVKLSGFQSSNITVLNVNDEFNPVKVNSSINAGDVEFKWPIFNNKGNRFFVFDFNSGAKQLGTFSVLKNFDFSEINSQTNYIIISPELFYNAAEKLLEHRKSQGWKGTLVKLENIYDAYSGGKKSIYAIKQFLKEIYTTYNKTSSDFFNVLLFGDTSYDYKGIISSSTYKCYIPAFESDNSFLQKYSYATDDFYSTLFQTNKYEIGVGRLPVASVSDAEAVVEKLIDYDTKSVYGDWRNTVTFVADDGLTSEGDDHDLHTSNAETVGNAPFVPRSIIKNKIYLINYQTQIGSDGRRKPEVTKDLISAMNTGTAIVNYSGHGNSKVWTHERVLEVTTFLPKLSNLSTLPFIITATCDFGQYDNDDAQSAAELFVLKPDGGAVGMFTTTRLVFTSQFDISGTNNLALNYALFRYLFNKDDNGNNLSIGEIYKLTKNRIGVSDENVQKFALLADPAMRLILPRTEANLTKQSGSYELTDSLKINSQTLTALSGEVYKNDGTLNSGFNGEIAFRLKSEPRTITIPEWKNYYTSSFEMEGQDVFRGTSSVVNGKFNTQFIVPKDVTVNQKSAKISGYYWNQAQDGFLNTPKVYFETNSNFIQTDSIGPDVRLFVNESSFVNGQTVNSNSEIIADILDSSGVNTTGLGIGHQLLGILDNNINESIDLSNYYSAAKDDFRKGVVKFPVTSLTPGEHTFELRVWDSFNNGTVKKVNFVIGKSDEFSAENLLPYPNPFSEKVYLYFNHNQNEGNFKIRAKIYTSNGLLIGNIQKDVSGSNNAGYIEWDGKDSDGDHVANGIYLINVSIEDLKSGKKIHKIAKVFYLK